MLAAITHGFPLKELVRTADNLGIKRRREWYRGDRSE